MNILEKYKKYKTKKNNNAKYAKKYKCYKVMIGGMISLDSRYLRKLDDVINEINKSREEKHKIDDSHGLYHGMIVLCNVSKALDSVEPDFMTDREKILVRLAALLHDIDDHKYFPNNHKFENARQILNSPDIKEIDNLTDNEIASILLMIYLVSSSTHGDTMPVGLPEWYFYPRYADRLEALGIIGLERTFDFTVTKKKQPLFTSETERALNEEDLYKRIATEERYKRYSLPGSVSASMMDHFYDKLLRLGNYPIKNAYFKEECDRRMQPLVDFCLLFSKTYPKESNEYPTGEITTWNDSDAEGVEKFGQFVKEFIKSCHHDLIRSQCAQQADKDLSELRKQKY